jgi:hypothetical protein
MKGHVLADPESGTVYETEVRVDSFLAGFRLRDRAGTSVDAQSGEWERVPSHARVLVTYEPDARLDLLLPARMDESYEGTRWELLRGERTADIPTRIECTAVYSDFRRFETAARVVLPK